MATITPASALRDGNDLTAPAPFELWAGSFTRRDLTVVSLTGREGLSRLFSFDVLVLAAAGAELLPLLGGAARLVIQVAGGAPRCVRGIVASVRAQGTPDRHGRVLHRIRLVPTLWLLKRQIGSRIFQDKTVPEIVTAVLAERGLPIVCSLVRAYPRRAYCVQHQESEYTFVKRLLAEEGIFFAFQHPTGTFDDLGSTVDAPETLLLGDWPSAYRALPALESGTALHYRDGAGVDGSDSEITHFSLQRAIRPGTALVRDYDFRRPALDLRSEARAAVEPGRIDEAPLRIYEHRGEYDEPEVSPLRAGVVLEQRRRRGITGAGESHCRRLEAGYRFELESESTPQLGGEYVVTHVEHEGRTDGLLGDGQASRGQHRTYANRFECVPVTATYRPKRPAPVLRQVTESARVVGPASEEIYTDEHGRIKVQFHWDLEGRNDDRSSCWIRVVQAWAGGSWGAQFIPRVGMEVIVTFLAGDQDCPIVTGTVYNATHPVPFKLPGEKTRSGIRTHSTPASEGYNELSFEDRRGEEQIRVIAQKDLDTTVANNHTRHVGNNETITVGSNRSVTIADHLIETVGMSRTNLVRGDAAETIGGGSLQTVTGSAQTTVLGDTTTNAKGQLSLVVGGEYSVSVGTTDKDANAALDVHGDYAVGASRQVRVLAAKSLRLSCGDSHIEITPDEIKIESKALTLIGAKSVSMEGKGPAIHLTDEAVVSSKTITLKSSQAFLQLDKEAKLKGKLVKLNCDEVDDLDEEGNKKPPPKTFRMQLLDAFHKPYAGKKYKLLVEGNVLEGSTDGDGFVEQDVSPEAASGDLTLFLGEPDKEPKLKWHLTLAELPPLDTPLGVRRRLKNLGYYRVAAGQSGDAQTNAIRSFQKDHALEPTGILDAKTKAKLDSVHG